MADRASVFSDDRIIARLQKDFIPVVLDTHEVQNPRSKTRDWFMNVAKKVKPDVDKITAQGRYVIAADGTAYGFNNNRDSERLLALLKKGEDAFRATPPMKVLIDGELLNEKYNRTPASDTTVVRIFSRIRPLPEGCHPSNRNVGRDHLWILAGESKDLLSGLFPASLAHRLCRYQLYDNIRGEPNAWAPTEIRTSEFTVSKRGEIQGRFRMETADGKRGIEGTMEGIVGTRNGKFFLKAYVSANSFGAGTYTPNPPEGRFPMVFAMETVDDSVSRVVPPQWIGEGQEYFGY